MPILTHPAFGPRTAIIYITVGTLIDVWTLVWFWAFGRDDLSRSTQFWLWGFFFSGLTLIVIGALLGQIGRSARKAELPPPEAVQAEANIQATAAANQAPVLPAGTMPNVVTPAPTATVMVPAPAANQPAAPPASQYTPGVTRR